MRGKDYNTGLRGVLFEARHHERMGSAIWLYGWLVLRQTHQHGSLGWVLGGSPVSYREIEEETGFNCRTLERWMHDLRLAGYIETEAAAGGLIIRVTKAKKFPQGVRKSSGAFRKFAEPAPQSCVASGGYPQKNAEVAPGIGSSSVAGPRETGDRVDFHRDFHRDTKPCEDSSSCIHQDPSCSGQNQNLRANEYSPPLTHPLPSGRYSSDERLLRQLLRAEREEAVRRELAVGTGPEVRRS
jgi:hypothetical protein